MAAENFVQASIPRFDGHYDHWSMLMENFLRSKEYWQVVSNGINEPTDGATLTDAQKLELEGQRLKDLKAKNYLFQAIDRAILETILCKDTSKHIWDSMKKKYQGSARAKRQLLQTLRSEFEILRMKQGESVSDYFSRAMAIVNKMRTYGDKVDDVMLIEKILRSMTSKFNFVVCSIEEANDIDELSIDELQSSLLVHEQKLNQSEHVEQALKASMENQLSLGGRGRGRSRGRGMRHGESRGMGRGGRYTDKSHIECYRCHKFGYYRSECRTNLQNQRGERTNFAEEVEDEEEEISLLMACHGNEDIQENTWYLDTGCSNHMSGDKTIFSELDESFHNTVKFGDNSTIAVMGKGEVTLKMNEGSIHTISNVLYVPDLKTNLLSVGQLQEKGYEISI